MKTWARFSETGATTGTVAEVFRHDVNPEPLFVPGWAWIEAPAATLAGSVLSGGKWKHPEPPPPPPPEPDPVPAIVTMRQAKIQLSRAGLLAGANEALAAIQGQAGEEARLEWEYATTLRRDHPLVAGIGQALGLDAAAQDDLFRAAALIG